MRWFALVILLMPAFAAADPGRLLDDHSFDTEPGGEFAGDLGIVAAKPTSLPVGLSTGIGAGLTRRCGCMFSYGARIAWSRVTEDSESWIVTQDDFRFRVTGAILHEAGRGAIALRLGAGPTIVHEVRDLQQGMRDPNSDTPQQQHALRAVPAGELELVVSLKIAGTWLVDASAGPTLAIDSGAHGGWITQMGVAWRP
ncbi:MAG: hypothetical protein ABJE66_01895 [Deltaproteobacteria bacterium]